MRPGTRTFLWALALAGALPGAEVVRDIEFAQAGGESLTLDVSVPEGKGPFATVIIVHGGGWEGGSKTTFVPPLFEPLTKAGFTWFTINYRLAPKHVWPAPAEDVDAAIRWVKQNAKKYKVDPKRIALVGESAGGHLVAYAAARNQGPASVAAAVPFYPPTDFNEMVKQRGGFFKNLQQLFHSPAVTPEVERQMREASPLTYVRKDIPPMLFIHGTKDVAVDFRQSTTMCDAMRKVGARCEVYPVFDAPHGMGAWEKNPAHQAYKEKMVDWLKTELRHGPVTRTALDRYVAAPDPSFRYALAKNGTQGDLTVAVLDMTSQSWRSSTEVDRTEWRHWLTIIRPKQVRHATALLYITGGANGREPSARPDAMLAAIAARTGAVVAELRMVPNQPLRFPDDPREKGLVEDAFVVYTWNKYLKGGDELWPARLPMTKAAVRAMDAVTAFSKTPEGGGLTVDKFVVSGGSKRGWTTWTAAAVDKRVVAIMPAVIDLLNIVPSFVHHWRALGFWTVAIDDYVQGRIMDWMNQARYRELMRIEEPFEYRQRLTIPKYMVNASGDDFFLPDSSQFYFRDLPGEKYLRYVPNTNHSLQKSDAPQNLLAYFDAFLNNRPRPKFDWVKRKDGSLRVTVTDKPSDVKLWQASNDRTRDFRLTTIGPKWSGSPLSANGNVYEARIPKPASGWSAFFVELTYPNGPDPKMPPLKFTTEVSVVPDVYPYPPPKPGDYLMAPNPKDNAPVPAGAK